MNDPLGERVRAVEVSLKAHLAECAKKRNQQFYLGITILGAVLSIVARQFGLL